MRSTILLRLARRGGAALAAGGAAVACAQGLAGSTTNPRSLTECLAGPTNAQFDDMVAKHQADVVAKGAFLEIVDIDATNAKQHEAMKRTDKLFIWNTLRTESGWFGSKTADHMLNRAAMWRWVEPNPPAIDAGSDVKPGLARVGAVVRVGDALDGPPNLVHGGFSAALLDDLLAWCAFRERDARGLPRSSLILTANLSVDYKRPVPNNSAYYVEVASDRLEKDKKLHLKATIFDNQGRACVEATSLYILKVPPAKKA